MRSRLRSLNRKVGRVIDRAGLEIRYTPFGYRGFESLTFRTEKENQIWFSFCFMNKKDWLQVTREDLSCDKGLVLIAYESVGTSAWFAIVYECPVLVLCLVVVALCGQVDDASVIGSQQILVGVVAQFQ